MKVALVLGLAFFCSLWSGGSLLKCSSCSSSVSYDDCQKTLTVDNCTNPNQACYQAEVKSEKGDVVEFLVQKGCLQKDLCDAYSKGDIGFCNTKREQNFTVDCKGKCCFDEDECNKGNLLNPPIDQGLPLKCSSCSSDVSYEDCQKKLMTVNCTEDQACFQADTKFEKGNEVIIAIQKGCVGKTLCDDYSKGEIGECKTRKAQGYTVDCNGKCCFDGDECNKENLLPNNQGSAFLISVMVLLLSVLLTLSNVN